MKSSNPTNSSQWQTRNFGPMKTKKDGNKLIITFTKIMKNKYGIRIRSDNAKMETN